MIVVSDEDEEKKNGNCPRARRSWLLYTESRSLCDSCESLAMLPEPTAHGAMRAGCLAGSWERRENSTQSQKVVLKS